MINQWQELPAHRPAAARGAAAGLDRTAGRPRDRDAARSSWTPTVRPGAEMNAGLTPTDCRAPQPRTLRGPWCGTACRGTSASMALLTTSRPCAAAAPTSAGTGWRWATCSSGSPGARPTRWRSSGWEGAYSDPRFERLTYAEADAARQPGGARAARRRRASPGDRVLLYCDNSIEAVITLFGIAKAGMVVVPVNSLLAADVLAHVLEHVEAVARRRRRGPGRPGAGGVRGVPRAAEGRDRDRWHGARGECGLQRRGSDGRPSTEVDVSDARRRHLGAAVHLGHDLDAEGLDDGALVPYLSAYAYAMSLTARPDATRPTWCSRRSCRSSTTAGTTPR